MRIAITGVRDGLIMIGLALLLCLFLLGAFIVADKYHINVLWVCFAWSSVLAIPAFLRAVRGHLKRPIMIPFLVGLNLVSYIALPIIRSFPISAVI